MSTVGTILAPWQKSNLQVYLLNTIGAAIAGTADFAFANIGTGPWPKKNKPIRDLGFQSAGGAHSLPLVTDYQHASVERPSVPVNFPFQIKPLTLAMGSLLQNKGVGVTNPEFLPYTDPQAKWFLGFEAQYGANAGGQMLGAVAKSVKISCPPSGADGGTPTLSVDFIGHSVEQISATTGVGTLDATLPIQSTDCAWTIGGAAMGHCAFDLSFENEADWDPQVGTTPVGIHLGKLRYSGSIKVVMSATAADEWNTIRDLWAGTAGAAPTASALVLTITFPGSVGTAVFNIPAVWDEPGDPEVQGNVMVCSMPFKPAYVDATHPNVTMSSTGLYATIFGSGLWTA